jgi:hypothetical protein
MEDLAIAFFRGDISYAQASSAAGTTGTSLYRAKKVVNKGDGDRGDQKRRKTKKTARKKR